MAEYKRFRTALGGFNRDDVSEYIEKSSREHQERCIAYETELGALRKEKTELLRQRDALSEKVERLHQLFGELEAAFRAVDEIREEDT